MILYLESLYEFLPNQSRVENFAFCLYRLFSNKEVGSEPTNLEMVECESTLIMFL